MTGLLIDLVFGITLQRGRVCFSSIFWDVLLFKDNYLWNPIACSGGICRYYLVGELDVIKPDQLLDMRGESCPIPDIQARKTLENISPGEVLLVIVDYPLSGERIPVSIHKEGHEIIKKIADKYGDIKIYIRRRQNA